MTRRLRVPALIVGGGPVGLYASTLLSSYGVPSILAERAQQPGKAKRHPRAHLINSRSMELLRELGVEPVQLLVTRAELPRQQKARDGTRRVRRPRQSSAKSQKERLYCFPVSSAGHPIILFSCVQCWTQENNMIGLPAQKRMNKD